MNDSAVAVSLEQLMALVEYLEAHPDLALGNMHLGKEGRTHANRLWKKCAGILNDMSPGCVRKSEKEWRTYYAEYKSKLKRKLLLIKRQQNATGASFGKKVVLTPLQKRLYNILEGADKFPASLSISPTPVQAPTEHILPQKHKWKQEPYVSDNELPPETNPLMDVDQAEQLHIEVIQKNTTALLENAAANRTLAAAIDRLTDAINLKIPSEEN